MLFALLVSLAMQSYGQVGKVQSGIVYYFRSYIEWPAAKQAGDFEISVLGATDLTDYLQTLAKVKTVGSRKITVKSVTSISEAKGSHILFLAENKLDQFDGAAEIAKSNNILLVTDKNGYGKKGAGINFITKDGKPSYEINQSMVNACELKVSSKLTDLGSVIN